MANCEGASPCTIPRGAFTSVRAHRTLSRQRGSKDADRGLTGHRYRHGLTPLCVDLHLPSHYRPTPRHKALYRVRPANGPRTNASGDVPGRFRAPSTTRALGAACHVATKHVLSPRCQLGLRRSAQTPTRGVRRTRARGVLEEATGPREPLPAGLHAAGGARAFSSKTETIPLRLRWRRIRSTTA